MNPGKFESIATNVKAYYDAQYPVAQDCVQIKTQLSLIQSDLDDIAAREKKSISNELVSPSSIPNPDYPTLSRSKMKINSVALGTALSTRNAAKVYLKSLLASKQNNAALAACDQQAQQSGTIATTSQTTATPVQTSFIQQNKKALIIFGCSVAVIAITIILKKRKP